MIGVISMVLVDLIKNAVIEASTTFRDDQLTAYKSAVKKRPMKMLDGFWNSFWKTPE